MSLLIIKSKYISLKMKKKGLVFLKSQLYAVLNLSNMKLVQN